MASKPKRGRLSPTVPETPDASESDRGEGGESSEISDAIVDGDLGDDEEDSDMDFEEFQGMAAPVARRQVNVEFQARTPVEDDSTGIRRFLTSMFGGSDRVNIDDLTDYIINQRNVGSVVTQCPIDPSDDEDDDDDYYNNVLALATVVKLRRDDALSMGVIEYLIDIVKKDDNLTKLTELLGNPNNSVGLLISERITNIPPYLSVPLLESLFKEIRKAEVKNVPHFDFTHFVIICRVLLSDDSSEEATIVSYRNPEEEVIEEVSQVIDIVCPHNARDTMVAINGVSYDRRSRLLVFKAKQMWDIHSSIAGVFPVP